MPTLNMVFGFQKYSSFVFFVFLKFFDDTRLVIVYKRDISVNPQKVRNT